MTRLSHALMLVTVAAVMVACGAILPLATPDLAVQSGIGVDNATALPVTIFLNGSRIDTVRPNSHGDLAGDRLPDLPWSIEARSPTGRVLLAFRVDPGMVTATTETNGTSSSRSAGARADLSCGRLDVYVGTPMVGPMPGPGVPGDCEP